MELMHLNSLLLGLPTPLPTIKILFSSSANLSVYFTDKGQKAHQILKRSFEKKSSLLSKQPQKEPKKIQHHNTTLHFLKSFIVDEK